MDASEKAMAERLGLPADDPAIQADLRRLMDRQAADSSRQADPGWYSYQGRLRWWDGAAWTNSWKAAARLPWSKSAELGMWLALFLPFIGFFVGLSLVAARDPHAHWVVLTSILVPIGVLMLLLL